LLRRPLRDDGQGLETPIDDARWIAVEFWLRVGPTLPPAAVQQLVQRHNHPLLVLATAAPARPRAPVHLLPVAGTAPDVHLMTASFAEALDSVSGAADAAPGGVPVLVRTQPTGLHAEADPLAWWPGARTRGGGSRGAAGPVHTAELVVPAAAPVTAALAEASTPRGANGKSSPPPPPPPPPPPEWPVMLDDCHWRDVFARSSCGRVLGWRGVGAYLVMAAVPLLGMLLAIMLTIPRVRVPKRHLD